MPTNGRLFVMDTWYDAVDWINTRNNWRRKWGGRYIGAMTTGSNTVAYGYNVGSFTRRPYFSESFGRYHVPVQGMDKNGPTAVIKSAAKLPTHRFALGGPLNLRLSPQLVASERDIDNLMSFPPGN